MHSLTKEVQPSVQIMSGRSSQAKKYIVVSILIIDQDLRGNKLGKKPTETYRTARI
jgi:hypothetical protein